MKYNFDKPVSRYGTYSVKWAEAQRKSNELAQREVTDLSYTSPDTVLPFMVADMDLRCADPIVQAMHKTADHLIYGYSGEDAEPEYRKSVVNWYNKRYGLDIKEEWITYSNGSVTAVENAIRAFSNTGDGVIICRPLYGHFNETIEETTNRKIVNCQLINENGYYTMDWKKFESLCAVPYNKIFILCSPANPVGRVWTETELKKIAEICRQNRVLLIADEIHCDIVRKEVKHIPILAVTNDYSNIILISGINKTFNVAGLSCANTIIPDEYLRGNFLKACGETLGTPFSIAAQIAAYNEGDEWLDQALDYIDSNIDKSINFLKQHMPKLKVWRPEGTYILWLDFTQYGLSSEEIHERIYNKAKVMLQDGLVHDPDLGGQFQRICIPTAWCIVEEGLKRIAREFADIN